MKMDGSVRVVPTPAARIRVGDSCARAGETAQFSVTLDLLSAQEIVGIQLDVTFDLATPIAEGSSGGPACRVDPTIGKEATAFVFQPMGCIPETNCTGVRAFVLSFTNQDPLPNGATLYTCDVNIPAGTVPGTYPLAASMQDASGPRGAPAAALASDGQLVVKQPPACPGDSNGDLVVGIAELIIGVNLLITDATADTCAAFDTDGSGKLTIAELIQGVNSALTGCSDAAANGELGLEP